MISSAPHSKTLLGGEETRRHGVVFIKLQQHVFQPVPHPQGELHQLGVHTLGYHWAEARKRQGGAANTVRPAERLTHVCRSRCNPGGAGVPSWCPPTCTWWRRVRRTCRTSCCPSHTPVTRVKGQHERRELPVGAAEASPT